MQFFTPEHQACFRQAIPHLLDWYQQNKRSLPWREDPTPYHVWVSEIMLQQTRVEAVKHHYTRFLSRYPTLSALADADPEELAKYWEGLGYYSRMRNLQRCAKTVVSQYDGVLPQEYDALLKLPGIGSYTAGAISSIAYGRPYAAVDGNVLRVLSRVFANDAPIDEQKVKTDCFALLNAVMPHDPGAFNQSLMELGATVCLPNGTPDCEHCPIAFRCKAHAQQDELAYPVKKPKKARKIEQITYLLILTDEGFLLHKRPGTGLLASLWEYPNLPGHLHEHEVIRYLQSRGGAGFTLTPLPAKKHIFTHIEWQIAAWFVRLPHLPLTDNEVFAGEEQIRASYALPTAFDQYDRKALINEIK